MSAQAAIEHLMIALAAAELPSCREGYRHADGVMTAASYPFRVGFMQGEIEKALHALQAPRPVKLSEIKIDANRDA